jgi:hypothetical protein
LLEKVQLEGEQRRKLPVESEQLGVMCTQVDVLQRK